MTKRIPFLDLLGHFGPHRLGTTHWVSSPVTDKRLRRLFLAGIVAAALIASALLSASNAEAVSLAPGDIVITADIGPAAGGEDYGVMRIDPLTGDRTIISDLTHGTGVAFDFSEGVSGLIRLPDNHLLVPALNGIFDVDPATGNRVIVSSTPAFAVARVGSQIFAVNSNLMSIDTTTGTATVLIPSIERGGTMASLDGNLYVPSVNQVYQYVPSGGAVNLYDGLVNSTAITPYFNHTLLLGSESFILITGSPLRSFDPAITTLPYGVATVSGPGVGTGPGLNLSIGLSLGNAGNIWDAIQYMNGTGAILSVDPATGNRTLFSDATHGAGPTFVLPTGLAVVPEPSTIALSLCGVLACGLGHWSSRRGTRT